MSSPPVPGSLWTCLKNGQVYEIIRVARGCGTAVEGVYFVVYEDKNGAVYVRASNEFRDGRFKPVALPIIGAPATPQAHQDHTGLT